MTKMTEMADYWSLFCDTNTFLSQLPSNISIPKDNYPKNLPEWYTEQDNIIGEIIGNPELLFFDPYKSIREEMQELETYEQELDLICSDEEDNDDDYSDYEWESVKNKF